jgi:hypothetical protein
MPVAKRGVPLRAITSDAEYRDALARLEELGDTDDLEVFGEMYALANYVEAWEEKVGASRSRSE